MKVKVLLKRVKVEYGEIEVDTYDRPGDEETLVAFAMGKGLAYGEHPVVGHYVAWKPDEDYVEAYDALVPKVQAEGQGMVVERAKRKSKPK